MKLKTMNIFNKCLAVGIFGISYIGSAQQIQTDRPNETENPSTITPKRLQVESGFSFEKEDDEKTFNVPEIVFRYGIFKNAEIRVETALKTFDKENEDNKFGIEPVKIGAKYHILDHKGKAIPDVSLLARVSIPWMADNAYQEEKYSPEIRLLAQNTLSKTWRLGYNLGVKWLPENLQPEYIYTLSADHSLSKKFKVFVEAYGFTEAHHHADNSADAGVLFLVTQNLQLDLMAGTGIMHSPSKKFAEIGVSFRI
ncbi:transporter [Flavobacterium sp.]|uniref:transporter n=1 Tax=Flavobacterium sp. TaxID=239 RepID=UPI00374D609E